MDRNLITKHDLSSREGFLYGEDERKRRQRRQRSMEKSLLKKKKR